MTQIPHVRIVVAFSAVAMLGYALFGTYVVLVSKDASLTGDVVGTWKSFAVAVIAFWLGSSSGGKAKADQSAPQDAKDAARLTANAADEQANRIEGATS